MPHNFTLKLDQLNSGGLDAMIRDVSIFSGGYMWDKDIHTSSHNRYAVDEPGFGREYPGRPSLAGSFRQATSLARKQTEEFIRWIEPKINEQDRWEIFGKGSHGPAPIRPKFSLEVYTLRGILNKLQQ
jgi:hypothetical protein